MNPQSVAPRSGMTGLASAIIAATDVPSLLLDNGFNVVAASTSFCHAFMLDPLNVTGRPLGALGAGEWAVPSLDALLTMVAANGQPPERYQMDLVDGVRTARRLFVDARRLNHDDPVDTYLMVTITEIGGAASLLDKLAHEQALQRREAQHRIANSLQIVASVLMHSARQAQTAEARLPLREAYNRVMSVAVVQQQLALSSTDAVELAPYMEALCRGIGASLIRDPTRIILAADIDACQVSGERAISLGLIVTELVINALKHAFPQDDAAGRITVDYRSSDAGWRLSVSDTGTGTDAGTVSLADGAGGRARAGSGLGTSIIDALVRKLTARVAVRDASPGTSVSVFADA